MRGLKFAKFLPENGWDPVVVTANPDDCYYQDAWNRDPELLKQLSSAAKVVSVPLPREKMVKFMPIDYAAHNKKMLIPNPKQILENSS